MKQRQIGRWGTVARLGVGTGLLVLAFWLEVTIPAVAMGLVGLPGIFIVALALRGREAAPLRLDEPMWHFANCGLACVVFSLMPVPAMLFYGSSIVIAGWRGIGACEIFAISNWIRGRDDRLGCPLFLPVDALEARAPSTPRM